MGQTLGMTSVHVNRSLQSLRAESLIALSNKRLTILDAPRLKHLGGFSAAYMHLGQRAIAVRNGVVPWRRRGTS